MRTLPISPTVWLRLHPTDFYMLCFHFHLVQNMRHQAHELLRNDLVDCRSGSSVHGILQARILEWVAISFFRESSQPRD